MFSPHELDVSHNPFGKVPQACLELFSRQRTSKTGTPAFPFSNGLCMEWMEVFQNAPICLVSGTESL